MIVSRNLSFYAPTAPEVADKMLNMVGVRQGENVLDIGSGLAGILIVAAEKYNANCVGIEMDHDLVERSRQLIKRKGLDGSIEIVEGDVFDNRIADADVVTLYLQRGGMRTIEDKLFSELKKSARIVSHNYKFPNYQYNDGIEMTISPFSSIIHEIYIYRMNDVKRKQVSIL
jgi:protein-L-isoaspartate O-methyltransferase